MKPTKPKEIMERVLLELQAYRNITDSSITRKNLDELCDDLYSIEELFEPDAIQTEEQGEHPDDIAVDSFAVDMKAKLAQSRAKGRSGWQAPDQCSAEYLAELFVGHLKKTNPDNFVDLANLLMMLHERRKIDVPSLDVIARAIEAKD